MFQSCVQHFFFVLFLLENGIFRFGADFLDFLQFTFCNLSRCFHLQQLLTGMSSITYWTSVFIFDLLLYSFVCGIILFIFWLAGWMTYALE